MVSRAQSLPNPSDELEAIGASAELVALQRDVKALTELTTELILRAEMTEGVDDVYLQDAIGMLAKGQFALMKAIAGAVVSFDPD